MAKQRRPQQPRPIKAPSQSLGNGGNSLVRLAAIGAAPARRPPPPPPHRRATYYGAVAIYERGLETLQRHDYQGAADLFESVLRQYPEEKELHERVRLYLNRSEEH